MVQEVRPQSRPSRAAVQQALIFPQNPGAARATPHKDNNKMTVQSEVKAQQKQRLLGIDHIIYSKRISSKPILYQTGKSTA